ncbi:PTS mannose/fructose/sorbose/N-acetylgalactosamine transporter subunit IIC [Atopobium fossor]|uniref:PTS mannose/fructose/sorbose/N-acetylgalactosamine transporter subunit IIC n=1 Tax=Atopobium fossor TaxID=39487 RepID=UPI00042197E6|nr:PTS sugar transporter subunit IIC [Atopobium fossor]
MLGQALAIGLIGAFGGLDYQLGTLYAFRPIVLCPLVGLVLGDLQAGLMIGASLELLFMGSISIGAYVPPDVTTGGVLSAAFAISLGQGTEAAIALAMPIATLALAVGNAINALGPLLLGVADKAAEKGDIKSVYIIHWILGLLGVAKRFGLCFLAFYFGADAVQGLLDWIPSFVLDGFGVAANILPVMGFAMLARMILNRELIPFFILGFLLTSYMNVPVLGVSLIAIIIAIEKLGLLDKLQPATAVEGDDDDDF